MSDDLDDVYGQLQSAPSGVVRVRLLEEAIRLADTQQDDERAAGFRDTLITESISAGLPDRALVAFTWLRNQARAREPGSALPSMLLWKLKWMAEELPYFLGVTREQIDAFFADMKQEYERAGTSLRPYYQHIMMAAMELGRPPSEVAEHYMEWQSGLRDGGADCAACERNFMVEYQLYQGDLELALDTAEPLLRGTLSCWQVPHRTVGVLLMPLYDEGERAEVEQLHAQHYDRCRTRGDLLSPVGAHIEAATLVGSLARARKGVEQHLAMALENAGELRRLPFLMGATAVLRRLAQEGRPLRLELPISPLTADDSSTAVMTDALRDALRSGLSSLEADGVPTFDAEVLAAGVEAELRHVVERADARGDQRYYAGMLERFWARHGMSAEPSKA